MDEEQDGIFGFSMKREVLNNVIHTRKAQLNVNSTKTDGALEFILISDDNGGVRYDWSQGGYYIEELDVNGATYDDSVIMFKDHSHSVDNAIARVTNIRVDNNQLVGDVIFGDDDNSQAIRNKYLTGILTDVSIGYKILGYNVEERGETEKDVVTVTSFEIFEVSAVGIGFDKGAVKREQENIGDTTMNEELRARLAELLAKVDRTADETAELSELRAKEAAEMQRRVETLEAENVEMKRQAALKVIAAKYGVDDTALTRAIDDKTVTESSFMRTILDGQVSDTSGFRGVQAQPIGEQAMAAMQDALAIRGGAEISNPHKDAEMFMRASTAEMAKVLVGGSGYDAIAHAERAMVSGQFPILLAGAGDRILTSEFDKFSQNYEIWTKAVDLPDFRKRTEVTTGTGGRLDKIGEKSDLGERGYSEGKEEWQLGSYGNKFVLTRQMIINDDLGAFNDMVADLMESSKITANGLTYDLLRKQGEFAGYKMNDGKAIFHSGHSNLADVDFSAEALKSAITAMGKHKGIDGKTKLNIKPQFLHVSQDNYFLALEILNSTASFVDNKNNGVVNVLNGIVTPIVDSELDGAEWYLTANRRTIKVGYLAGTGRRPQIKINDSSLLKTTFEGVFDFGVMAEDYRGMYAGKMN